MARDAECGSRPFRDEHQRKRVERSGPLDQFGILETESPLRRHEYIMHREVVAAGPTQSRRVPGVEDLHLGKFQETGPRFRNAFRVYALRPVFNYIAADPHPLSMLTSARKRKAPPHSITAADARPHPATGLRVRPP